MGSLRYNHIGWEADALTVTLCVTKSDQEGDNVYTRHVYANPLDPLICPILHFGLKLLSTPFVDGCSSGGRGEVDGVKVFEGDSSETRFCQWLVGILGEPDMQRGTDGKNIGTHSFRKGVLTHCSSCPGGPPPTAIFLRAGWSLGTVLTRLVVEWLYCCSYQVEHKY